MIVFFYLGTYVWDHCGAETKAVASQTLFQFYCLVDQNLMFSAFITQLILTRCPTPLAEWQPQT